MLVHSPFLPALDVPKFQRLMLQHPVLGFLGVLVCLLLCAGMSVLSSFAGVLGLCKGG